ncbi:MAG TPA: amidohydrolase family protein [Candidatus Tectomicrobia bacterium]|nr:amidohydrolase family protein [Candidatus Tectomicrobia bacterium]
MSPARRARRGERVPAIDIHAHYFPEAYLRAIETQGEHFGVTLDRSDPAGPAIKVGAVLGGHLRREFYDLGARLKAMDRAGVQVHALSLTMPMVYWADAELGARLARLVNDAMSGAHVAHPDRFVGLATLPMQDPKRAAEEVDRAAGLPGIRGIYLGTNVNGTELDDPSFTPVFERIHARGLPVFLHPLNVVGAQRLAPYYLGNLLGNPYDTGIAAAHLIFGGVLDRFPRLSVCLPHAGGTLPYLVGRLDHGRKVRRELAHMKRPPSAYLRRFTYDTISHAPASLRYLIDLVGSDRVMIGSDYCFDMGYERPVEVVTRLGGLSRADQDRILGGTAARLLRIR